MAKELFIDVVKVTLKTPNKIASEKDVTPYTIAAAQQVYDEIDKLYLEDLERDPDMRIAVKRSVGSWSTIDEACNKINEKITRETIHISNKLMRRLMQLGRVYLSLVGGEACIDDILDTPHYITFTLLEKLKDANIIDLSTTKTVWVDAKTYELKSAVPIIRCDI